MSLTHLNVSWIFFSIADVKGQLATLNNKVIEDKIDMVEFANEVDLKGLYDELMTREFFLKKKSRE